MKIFLVLLITIYSFCAFSDEHGDDAHGDHDEKEKKEEEAITLTEQAVKNFGIKVQKIVPKDQKAEIPITAVVDSEDKKQIFIVHEGKYEVRDVNVVKRTSSSVTVDSFSDPEDVVVSGVNYLKVVEMSHGEEGGGGHGH